MGTKASIAVDSLGNVYISYYDSVNQNLKYATNWKGWWEVTTLASTGNVGVPSFVFSIWGDQAPNVYVGYLNATTHKVMFMYSEEEMLGYWSEPEIISGNLNVSNFAMTMRGYQAYVSLASGGNIYYATSMNWSVVELVGEGQAITAIAVTNDGTPYIPISYDETYVPWGWITHLAYRENNIWVSPTQDNPSNLIFGLGEDLRPEALSIQASGNEVYIAMQLPGSSVDSHKLYIARGAKNIWDVSTRFTVESNIGNELFPAVAVSPSTIDLKAGVVYLNGNLLEYQFLSSMTDTWSKNISPVDTSLDIGKCAVLRADNTGNLHLMYYRSDTGALYYKFTTPSGWSPRYTIVDTSTAPDEWARCSDYSKPSMDLLSDGSPVFSYVNSANQLIYAKWSCGRVCGFSHEVLDTGVTNGATAVAIGSADNPNVLYHKSSHLKFAYKPSPGALTWSYAAVIDSLDTYSPLSMETDNNGKLHAAFVDMMYDHPRYARFGFGGEFWSNISLIEPTDYTLQAINIAVDPVSNFPRVAFIVSNSLDSPLVVRSYSTALDWNSRTTIDSSPDLLSAPSFTIDSAGTQLFAYYYKNLGQGVDGLKFMKRTGSIFSPILLEPSIGLIDSTSIALRPGNVPVIAYHVPALGQIKVAWGPNYVFLPLVKR